VKIISIGGIFAVVRLQHLAQQFLLFVMSGQGITLALSAGITAVVQFLAFVVSYALQTETFYDVMGGLNYLFLAAFTVLYIPSGRIDTNKNGVDEEGGSPDVRVRTIGASVLFVASRGWLLLFLGWRAWERRGDSRFDGVVEKAGTFFLYWTVQAFWVFLVSMPVIFINSSSAHAGGFTALDVVTMVGWALGILIEIAADTQKAVWVKRGRKGHFCSVGIWNYSRHPNYFGELLQWWCAWLLALSSSERGGVSDPLWWACILSPLFTTQLLLNQPGTGLVDAEGKGLKRYYDKCPTEYEEYRKSTSILMPMIGYKYVPLWLKRSIFLDFERYEYRPNRGNSDGSSQDGEKDTNKSSSSLTECTAV